MANFLLIHGAYQGGWIWTRVAAKLRAAGHTVFAPTMDGCAERRGGLRKDITLESCAAELAQLMFYEDLKDVVLAGTSNGGMVMCKTAELARERVGRLMFVDALALLDGEKVSDIVVRGIKRETTELATGPTKEDIETRLFKDLDPDTRTWAVARYTLQPIATLEAPVKLPSFWSQSWKARVIYCKRSTNPPEVHQRRCAERLKADWRELDTGHYPMLSTPDELAKLLMA
ncbi:MAG: alpha/beta hydrolase [Proteobacteria bacterium]|nr:alpha/beta hydrolase [Pseudomonadota bacterium]